MAKLSIVVDIRQYTGVCGNYASQIRLGRDSFKRVFAFPATQMMAGKAPQLAVNQWQQLLQGFVITAPAVQQNLRHVLGRLRHEVAA